MKDQPRAERFSARGLGLRVRLMGNLELKAVQLESTMSWEVFSLRSPVALTEEGGMDLELICLQLELEVQSSCDESGNPGSCSPPRLHHKSLAATLIRPISLDCHQSGGPRTWTIREGKYDYTQLTKNNYNYPFGLDSPHTIVDLARDRLRSGFRLLTAGPRLFRSVFCLLAAGSRLLRSFDFGRFV
ncbi:hypothetical protein PGT21_036903 [Puccinia graminis f. sp. tritici]|uniref:Uncharacterized protein n=1 Tax=Puccinia graminis f. sp. tritici TaxID=56615 RepID=A0A5B0Q0Z3_PUCGR|nr:hypothetical protein PGT21_036903 [Puccinia graminis f. sp. tritici]